MTNNPQTVEERVARHLAARNYLMPGDTADDAWWNSRDPELRKDYLAYAREVIAIVQPAAVPVVSPPANRAAVLREAADAVAADTEVHIRYGSAKDYADRNAALLRRMAYEAQERACPTPLTHNWGCGCPSDVAAAIASCPGREMDGPSPCRCPCYGCKHHCGAHDPSTVADEAQRQPDTETPDDDVVERHETVLYCIQTQQPDGSWEDSSSVLSSPEHAAGPLAERRKYWPQFEHRIVQHVTTVVVQLMDEQPATAPAVVSQPGKEG